MYYRHCGVVAEFEILEDPFNEPQQLALVFGICGCCPRTRSSHPIPDATRRAGVRANEKAWTHENLVSTLLMIYHCITKHQAILRSEKGVEGDTTVPMSASS